MQFGSLHVDERERERGGGGVGVERDFRWCQFYPTWSVLVPQRTIRAGGGEGKAKQVKKTCSTAFCTSQKKKKMFSQVRVGLRQRAVCVHPGCTTTNARGVCVKHGDTKRVCMPHQRFTTWALRHTRWQRIVLGMVWLDSAASMVVGQRRCADMQAAPPSHKHADSARSTVGFTEECASFQAVAPSA
jgi:hypothetical protein